MRKKWVFIVPAAIVGICLFAALGGEIVRELWNWLLPPLFGWREITFWQALGLLALCRILFGGWGGGGRSRSRFGRLSPEDREGIRQRIRARCGFSPESEPQP
jgi:hypothetical protein